MEKFFYISATTTTVLLMIYLLMIINYNLKWKSLAAYENENKTTTFKTKVSIIVAARNEEEKITELLKCLASQNYSTSLFEILIIDDHSKDKTADLTNQFIIQNSTVPIKLIQLQKINPELKNKKAAIQIGIEQSSGELIITTDADCKMDGNWLSTIVSYYELYHPQMIVCPVLIAGDSFFQNLQQLEFLSLIAITASSIKAAKPLMCNGANLAYTRKIFLETGGFESNAAISSGDDTFLMFNIWKQKNDNIHFLKSNNATVTTQAQKNIHSFLQQRIRWASKTTQYNLTHVTRTGYFIAAINFTLLTLAVLSFFNLKFVILFIFAFSIKLFIDTIYLFNVALFFKQKQLFSLPIILVTALLYPLYIFFISLKSQFGQYEWKGKFFGKNNQSL